MIGDILQPTHLLFVLVVALLVLGPKRLPEAGRALGRGIRDFRMAIGGEDDRPSEVHSESHPAPAPEAVVPPAAAPPVESTPAPGDPALDPTASAVQQNEQPVETAHSVG